MLSFYSLAVLPLSFCGRSLFPPFMECCRDVGKDSELTRVYLIGRKIERRQDVDYIN